jgi:hypothetical protein
LVATKRYRRVLEQEGSMATKTTKAAAKAAEDQNLALFSGMADQFGDGFANVDTESLSISVLKIGQPMSPAVLDGKVKVGEFYHSVTHESFGSELDMVLLDYRRVFIEWEGEGADSRLVDTFLPEEVDAMVEAGTLRKDGLKLYRENGNQLSDTREFAVYLPDHPDVGVILFPLSSTGITHSRKVISMARAIHMNGEPAPLFSKVWRMETVENKNEKGRWYTIGEKGRTTASPIGWIGADIVDGVKGALGFAKQIAENRKQITYAGDSKEATEDSTGASSGEF